MEQLAIGTIWFTGVILWTLGITHAIVERKFWLFIGIGILPALISLIYLMIV